MGDGIKRYQITLALLAVLFCAATTHASEADSLVWKARFQQALGLEFRPEWIVPTNDFLAGKNAIGKPLSISYATHLRYSFRFMSGSQAEKLFGGVYQGVGLAYYALGNQQELGNPGVVYLFQGGRIARIGRQLSFNYEWNLGLSFGWKPYDPKFNSRNIMMGSRINAYLNVGFYFDWAIMPGLSFTPGVVLTHFSNGNTTIPNAGHNSIGAKIGLTYNFAPENRNGMSNVITAPFPRHVSYDLTLFGSWRRKGVAIDGKMYASPDAYPVAGFSFAPMYNFGYKFRAGVSLDGVYDGSANVYTKDYIVGAGDENPGYTFYKPSIDKQLALGVSARAEFVMPYFSIGIGMGWNVIHKGGDLRAFYQMLTLKIAATRSSYIHIGYNLKDFHMPNYLMLGIGYRFNNKYPTQR